MYRRRVEDDSIRFALPGRGVPGRGLDALAKANVRIRIIGSREGLSADILGLIDECEARTRDNTGLTLIVAFNYGGRQEIVRAVQHLAQRVQAGELAPEAIDERVFAANLDTSGVPDPDLVIRTSGEKRVSNFLPWQSAYAEYVFLDDLWPDLDKAALERAIAEYAGRERRFGGLGKVVSPS